MAAAGADGGSVNRVCAGGAGRRLLVRLPRGDLADPVFCGMPAACWPTAARAQACSRARPR
jgi:hypothetical protein